MPNATAQQMPQMVWLQVVQPQRTQDREVSMSGIPPDGLRRRPVMRAMARSAQPTHV